MERKNAWKTYSEEDISKLNAISAEYVKFLDNGKTERECVTETVAAAKAAGTTRAVASMHRAAQEHPGAILAVGNAPTALLTIAEEIEAGLRPALVIGVPVGFVNVVESKEILFAACEAHGVPAIAAMGRKGGSNVAAAICNALVYSAAEMLDPTARGWK